MRIPGPARWFSFTGRAGRREYLLQSLIILTLDSTINAAVMAALDAGMGGWTLVRVDIVLAAVSLAASWAVIFRRLHDLGVRGWAVFGPLLGLGAALAVLARLTGWQPPTMLWGVGGILGTIALLAIPGAPGTNRFGPARGASNRVPMSSAP